MPDKLITEELREQISKLKAPNIAVIGGTGVGKSTLINSVFGAKLAPTGAGLPVTNKFVRYPEQDSDNDLPIVIYDSAGYEAGTELFQQKVLDFLQAKQQEGIDQQIHLVWYIINAASARVTPFEKTILDSINQQGIPAIIVLSQCDRASEEEIRKVGEALTSFNLNKVYDTIKTAASPLVIRGELICEPFGLEELVDKTSELLPKIYTDAVIAIQVVNLQAKRKVVWKYIYTAAAASFTVGASPLPGTSAALIASQTGLCIAIASVYGYKDIAEFLVSIGTVTAFNTLLTAAIGDLLGVLFPGGGVLTAGASASYIVVFGLACTAVFENMAKDNLQGKGKEEIKRYLQDSFKHEFQKYSLLRINSTEQLDIVKNNFLNPS
ncbi:MAG: GTPase family protein [Gloeotrichia echinulata GP01]